MSPIFLQTASGSVIPNHRTGHGAFTVGRQVCRTTRPVNTGLTVICIAKILNGVKTPLTSEGVQQIFHVANEQLRLLAHAVELALVSSR
jgi:hypothetical protein